MVSANDCSRVLRKFVTRFMDGVFKVLPISAQGPQGPAYLQLFLCFVNLAFSLYPILMYFWFSNDIHVMFWLGMAPQYANLTVPISLCFLNFGVNIITWLRLKTGKSQKLCFGLFLLLAAANLTAGSWVLLEASRVSNDLIHNCGSTPLTARIEGEWQRLSAFYSACQVNAGKTIFIQECPYFTATFPNRVYVNYIEDVEIDFNCVGFCQFWAQPIFNLDSDRGLRCANALGDKMQSVGDYTGIPTVAMGITLGLWGMCLLVYDHL